MSSNETTTAAGFEVYPDLTSIPPDSLPAIKGRNWWQKLFGRPATLAFLDTAANCTTHANNIRATTNRSEINHVVGIPGVPGFHIPAELAPIQPLLVKAATVAALRDKLGKSYIQLGLWHKERPLRRSNWHRHSTSPTHLICSDAASTYFDLSDTGPAAQDLTLKPRQTFAPLAGLPVTFDTITHSEPYLKGPAPGVRKPSSVLLIYEIEEGEAAWPGISPALRQMHRDYKQGRPKPWQLAPL